MQELKAKLEQAERDKELAMFNAEAEISRIRQQIADSEVTYSIGDRFTLFNTKRMLVEVDGRVSMIALDDGCHQARSGKVGSFERITQSEFDELRNGCKYTRYWDSRKQCKC